MSASPTNVFNINVSDNEVRITFMDQRPAVVPDKYGQAPSPSSVTDIAAEVVMSQSIFRQLLDLGDKLLDQHAQKQKEN